VSTVRSRLENGNDFEQLRDRAVAERDGVEHRVRVCLGTGCMAKGAGDVFEQLQQAAAEPCDGDSGEKPIVVGIKCTGCHGLCERGPLVVVDPGNIFYQDVKAADVPDIWSESVIAGRPVERLLYNDDQAGLCKTHEEIPFYREQQRIVLAHSGVIDPTRIEEYIAVGGYSGLAKALDKMTPDEVIDEVLRSGLRGRGGGGFPSGRKWRFARDAEGDQKYIIANADEGDPGAFMNRSLLEGDPHILIEGMLLAGYAIGASEAYIYCRAEYPLAIERTRVALEQAKECGLLGDDILGSGFSFKIKIKEGAGAFVCGEETALIASIEGMRGMPRPRPPFPAVSGLWQKPTIINNVETLACVAQIMQHGADWFADFGTEKSKGTKTFALVGKVKNTGLVEVALGTTLRKLIFEIGGGTLGGKPFKAVQTGGPSGGCLPADLLDTPVDYDSLQAAGTIMGSGGMVVMDEETCMVDVARYFLEFTQKESCGECVPCRLGTKQMLDILEDIVQGKGSMEDLELLTDVGHCVSKGSLCGLGQTAPNPVLTTLRYFRDEYEAHIRDKRCPAKVCKALISFSIDEQKCIGCMVCAKTCPVNAIEGEKKQPHRIIQEKCIRCGMCQEVCPKKASAVERHSGQLVETG
jgi:NADH-quinone oxidoreductase subunit F